MQHFKFFFFFSFFFFSLNAFGQVAEPKEDKKPKSGTPSKPSATPAPQKKTNIGDAVILVQIDYASTLYFDGKKIGFFQEGSFWKHQTVAGKHFLQLKTEKDVWETEVICTSKMQIMVKSKLAPIVKNRKAKEERDAENARKEAEKVKFRQDSIKRAEAAELKRQKDSTDDANARRKRSLDSLESARIETQRIADEKAAKKKKREKEVKDSLAEAKRIQEARDKAIKELAAAEERRKKKRLLELKSRGIQSPEIIWDLEENMVEVKGGEFKMGCTADQIRYCEADERPVRNTEVVSFRLSKFEVTQELWDVVMDTNVSAHQNCAKCPVENIRFGDVQVFISKLNKLTGKNYRLPTEAEWEYAARGGTKAAILSPALSEMAWYGINSGNMTHEVGKLKPNALGLYDMLGNVWEYCSDWYDPAYYNSQYLNNPKGPSSGAEYVIRGGSYFSTASECRVANRNSVFPIMTHKSYGFRLAE